MNLIRFTMPPQEATYYPEDDCFTFAHDVPGGRDLGWTAELDALAREQMEKVRDQIEAERGN